jgi:hypothetical protein
MKHDTPCAVGQQHTGCRQKRLPRQQRQSMAQMECNLGFGLNCRSCAQPCALALAQLQHPVKASWAAGQELQQVDTELRMEWQL